MDGGARMSEAGGTASSVARNASSPEVRPACGLMRMYQATPGAAANTPTPTSSAASRAPLRPGAGAVRSRRPALTSNAQASATTSGKPSASATTTYESTASGQCKPCVTGSMIWRTANAAMP